MSVNLSLVLFFIFNILINDLSQANSNVDSAADSLLIEATKMYEEQPTTELIEDQDIEKIFENYENKYLKDDKWIAADEAQINLTLENIVAKMPRLSLDNDNLSEMETTPNEVVNLVNTIIEQQSDSVQGDRIDIENLFNIDNTGENSAQQFVELTNGEASLLSNSPSYQQLVNDPSIEMHNKISNLFFNDNMETSEFRTMRKIDDFKVLEASAGRSNVVSTVEEGKNETSQTEPIIQVTEENNNTKKEQNLTTFSLSDLVPKEITYPQLELVTETMIDEIIEQSTINPQLENVSDGIVAVKTKNLLDNAGNPDIVNEQLKDLKLTEKRLMDEVLEDKDLKLELTKQRSTDDVIKQSANISKLENVSDGIIAVKTEISSDSTGNSEIVNEQLKDLKMTEEKIMEEVLEQSTNIPQFDISNKMITENVEISNEQSKATQLEDLTANDLNGLESAREQLKVENSETMLKKIDDTDILQPFDKILDLEVREEFTQDIPKNQYVPLDINIAEESSKYSQLKDIQDYVVEHIIVDSETSSSSPVLLEDEKYKYDQLIGKPAALIAPLENVEFTIFETTTNFEELATALSIDQVTQTQSLNFSTDNIVTNSSSINNDKMDISEVEEKPLSEEDSIESSENMQNSMFSETASTTDETLEKREISKNEQFNENPSEIIVLSELLIPKLQIRQGVLRKNFETDEFYIDHQIIKKPGVKIHEEPTQNDDASTFRESLILINDEPESPDFLQTVVEVVEITAEIKKSSDNFRESNEKNSTVLQTNDKVVEAENNLELVEVTVSENAIVREARTFTVIEDDFESKRLVFYGCLCSFTVFAVATVLIIIRKVRKFERNLLIV